MNERTYPETGMTLNEIVKDLGIETIYEDPVKWILPSGEKILRPQTGNFERSIEEHLHIRIVWKDEKSQLKLYDQRRNTTDI